ncbi:MAG TPA: hypothetical protein VGA82_01445 [Dehalococcoidales bacterium]
MSTYHTWYEFKRELERQINSPVLNGAWLRVKPASPLPWNNEHLRSTVAQLRRLNKSPGQ